MTSFLSADILLAHLIGDYILQSDWMAQNKNKSSLPALAHVIAYSLPFLFLTTSPAALLFIAGSHFVIDRFRLARYVCWAKNFLGPGNRPWSECTATGYSTDRPAWMVVWLMIITDNTMHLICNAGALRWLT
jgi:Protein of unknown function (DUF3307)